MLLKNMARLSISPSLSFAPMRLFLFSNSGSSSTPPPKNTIKYKQKLQSHLHKDKNRPFMNLLTNQRYSFFNMGQFFNSFEIRAFENYPSLRDITWKHSLIQSLEKGADVSFLQPKLQKLQELRFNIKQNRLTTFQSFNQYIVTPKSQVKSDKRLNKENKLKSQKAIAYIEKVLYENPKNENCDGLIEMYRVHKVATASISKNLKKLFAKCDQHPGEYCIATPNKISDYQFIDFIIAKKQLAKYHIFTFDVSILNKRVKIKDAKALFTDLLSRQKGKPNYIINHVALCHKDAEQSIPYNIKKGFNIFCSPWDEITFRSSNNKLALNTFYRMRDINNTQNKWLKKREEEIKE